METGNGDGVETENEDWGWRLGMETGDGDWGWRLGMETGNGDWGYCLEMETGDGDWGSFNVKLILSTPFTFSRLLVREFASMLFLIDNPDFFSCFELYRFISISLSSATRYQHR